MDQKYRISFHTGNTGFDVESTDLEWLEKKEKEYLEKVLAIPERVTTQIQAQENVLLLPQNLTINEFFKRYIKKNNISSRPDVAVFFVYYLQRILKKDAIKTADVAQCFADVSYPSLAKINFADALNQAKKKALLNNVNAFWSLTITGEDFVVNTMTDENK